MLPNFFAWGSPGNPSEEAEELKPRRWCPKIDFGMFLYMDRQKNAEVHFWIPASQFMLPNFFAWGSPGTPSEETEELKLRRWGPKIDLGLFL